MEFSPRALHSLPVFFPRLIGSGPISEGRNVSRFAKPEHSRWLWLCFFLISIFPAPSRFLGSMLGYQVEGESPVVRRIDSNGLEISPQNRWFEVSFGKCFEGIQKEASVSLVNQLVDGLNLKLKPSCGCISPQIVKEGKAKGEPFTISFSVKAQGKDVQQYVELLHEYPDGKAELLGRIDMVGAYVPAIELTKRHFMVKSDDSAVKIVPFEMQVDNSFRLMELSASSSTGGVSVELLSCIEGKAVRELHFESTLDLPHQLVNGYLSGLVTSTRSDALFTIQIRS